jgi:uncharacterized protein involved in response to NO
LWSIGFRPFFLLAGVSALVIVPSWIAVLLLGLQLPAALPPLVWHAHEMLFGYTAAVIAGFLLTAVRNWTGRDTASGSSLVALCALWLAGRVVCAAGAAWPGPLCAAIDVAFLPAVAWTIGLPIVRTRNWRNAGMPLVLLLLACGNLLIWSGALRSDWPALAKGQRLTLDVIALLIVVIGGRIIPGFTANAVTGLTPRAQGWLDRAGIASMVALIAIDALGSGGSHAAFAAGLAGAVNAARLWGWGGSRTLSRPILWVLHLGFAWTAAALVLRAVAQRGGAFTESTATHALTVGGIGLMTLGMMTRVALGHTGRRLELSRSAVLAIVALALSALARVAGPLLWPAHYPVVLALSALLWTLSFGLFLLRYTPILLAPRSDE